MSRPISESFKRRGHQARHAYNFLYYNPAHRHEIAQAEMHLLPAYDSLDAELQQALGDGKGYDSTVVATVAHVAKFAEDRDEFERICGLYGSGYKSLIRSTLHAYASQRELGLSPLRRGLRLMYHHLRRREEL
jgi:hypothetical protein